MPESENAHVLPVTPSFGAVVNVPMVPERPLALPRMNSYVPPSQNPVGHCVEGLSSTQPVAEPLTQRITDWNDSPSKPALCQTRFFRRRRS